MSGIVYVFESERPDGWYIITKVSDEHFQVRGAVDENEPFESEDAARVAAAFDLNEPYWTRPCIDGRMTLAMDES